MIGSTSEVHPKGSVWHQTTETAGRISELHALRRPARRRSGRSASTLSDAVREVTGEPFEIFQDVGGIGIGEHWPGKLDQMLDEARFFIPIVTPSYFTSKPCREELEKFLRAEAERERNDLVLPIYYIESEVMEDDDLRAADPLAKTLHERHRQDWRELRFEPFEAANVRRALERLAREIVKARRRPMIARQSGPPEVGTVFRDVDAPWCPELVVIPPGEFMMGSTEAEREWAVEQGREAGMGGAGEAAAPGTDRLSSGGRPVLP